MSLAGQIDALATRVGQEFKALRTTIASTYQPLITDTGWVTFTPGVGEAPFAVTTGVSLAKYRRVGDFVNIRMIRDSSAIRDNSANTTGDFTNVNLTAVGVIPTALRPVNNVAATAMFGESPTTAYLQATGTLVWTGGYPRSYPSGTTFRFEAAYFID